MNIDKKLLYVICFTAMIMTGAFGQTPPQQKVSSFALNQVSLLPGPCKSAMDRTCNYLRYLNKDKMLYSFRKNYGLSTQGATSYGGWEASNNSIRGHTMGHLLSALAQAYQATGTIGYKEKADSLIVELQKCQDAAVGAGFKAGFLAAIPETFVDAMLNRQSARCPLYNMHKTFAGLLDCYTLTGNATALDMAKKMADWAISRMGSYTQTQLSAIWDDYSVGAGEYGGFGEAMATLYEITGTAKYLTAAHYFDHTQLFTPLLSNTDALKNRHGNRSIPEIIGALKIYQTSGDANSYTVAKNFFSIVTRDRCYITGGTTVKEYFRDTKAIASNLTDENNETCCIYNMLKMTRRLYLLDPQPAYFDYYERALYNQILASQDTVSPNGHTTYFQPMRSGGIKLYGDDNDTFRCCQGTGLENHTKYNESIFFYAGDTLIVNLFIASTLNWADKKMTVKMETLYPQSDTIKLTVTGTGTMPLKVRAPFWLQKGVSVSIDGEPQTVNASPSSYFTINKPWTGTNVVTLVMPQTLRYEKTPDKATVGGVMYGAQVLVGCYGTNNLSSMPTLDASTIKKTSSIALKFSGTASTGTVTMVPYYQMHNQRYSIYWNLTNVPVVSTLPDRTVATETNLNPTLAIQHSQCILFFHENIMGNTNVTVSLFTVDGKLIMRQDAVLHAAQKKMAMEIPLQKIKSTVYVCVVSVNNRMYKKMIVIGQ